MKEKLLSFFGLLVLAVLSESAIRGKDPTRKTEELLPEFVREVPNITVTLGRDVTLPCTVEQLMGYKVAWVQIDTQTILTIHKQVITRNPRIFLLHSDPRSWDLHIRGVRESDRGWYMCQINTDPMKSQAGYLDVVVPPDIIDRESSGDITIKEGEDVTLRCRARGHPKPTIFWRREDNQPIFPGVISNGRNSSAKTAGDSNMSSQDGIITAPPTDGGRGGDEGEDGESGEVKQVEGETLILTKVSRLQMASYLCIAYNGVPPSISKRAHLRVQFPPMTWVPQQLEGAYIGQELTIECHTEAFPRSINYWTNPKGDMVVSDTRYEPTLTGNSYKIYMTLKIRAVSPDDLGTFSCVAKNSLGETDGRIRVYEIEPPEYQNKNEDAAKRADAINKAIIKPTSPPMPPVYIPDSRKYNSRNSQGANDFTNQRNKKGHSYRSHASLHDLTTSNPGGGGSWSGGQPTYYTYISMLSLIPIYSILCTL